MQVLATPVLQRQKRSLSYNDLKKKRLMRSAQSHKKLNQQADHSTVKKKGMTQVKSILSSLPQDEKIIQGCINELKGVLGSLRQRSSKKRIVSIRQSMTQRSSIRQSIDMNSFKKKPSWNNIEQSADTKQLIKHLLNKNKTQRRLMKFNDIRDKFKKEKERSLSNDHQKSFVKHIPSPIKELKDKTLFNQPQENQKDIYNKRTQPTLKNIKPKCLQQQLDQLQQLVGKEHHKKWRDQITGKENEQINTQHLQISDISSINCRNIEKFNQSELKVIENNQSQQNSIVQGSFLKLLSENMSKGKKVWNKQVRRKGELERMKKIFPLGFFDN